MARSLSISARSVSLAIVLSDIGILQEVFFGPSAATVYAMVLAFMVDLPVTLRSTHRTKARITKARAIPGNRFIAHGRPPRVSL